MERHYNDVETKSNKKSTILITSLICLLLFLGAVRVMIANASVEASFKLRKLDTEIAALESENQLLAENIRVKESLTTLTTKAGKLGFTKTNKYAFVEKNNLVASLNEFFR